MCDATRQMTAEVRVGVAILPVRSAANAVREDGLQAIVLNPPHVRPDVQHHAGHLLADALTHEVRLAGIHLKALFESDPADVDMEAADDSFQCFAAGENKVVGIARVGSVQRGPSCPDGSRDGRRRDWPRRARSAPPAANGGMQASSAVSAACAAGPTSGRSSSTSGGTELVHRPVSMRATFRG